MYGVMLLSNIKKSFDVYGMHCKSCETIISDEINDLPGIISVDPSYTKSIVTIFYNNELCSEKEIKNAIKNAGYGTKYSSTNKVLGLAILAFAMIFLANNTFSSYDTNSMLENSSIFMLFIVGLLSSLHCVGMCGGIMLTQTLDKDNLLSNKKTSFNIALKYNLGRVISYSILGGIIGMVGSIFSVSMKAQGLIQIIASLLMIIAGLNMFGFKLFKNINLKFPFIKNNCKENSKSPFIVGLLNGFMPCGALQTMQLYALSTGNFFMGALSMFIFALGTVPLMLGFGYISSILSKSFSNKIFKYSGIFIIILGLSMAQRGFALSGYTLPFINSVSTSKTLAPVVDGYQEITITANRYGYNTSHSIKEGLPVRLTIKSEELTNCNKAMYFPDFDQYVDLSQGDVLAELTTNGENINYTCWMGMIRGSINVEK